MHFSSPSGCRFNTWRPCQRGAVGFFSSGYCSVLTFLNMVEKVTPKPLIGLRTSLHVDGLGESVGSSAGLFVGLFVGTAGHLLAGRMRDCARRELAGQRRHREPARERVVGLVLRARLR